MSLIKTDAIQTLAGKPILNSTGSVLQVVTSQSTGLSGAITSASYVVVPNFTAASITPSSTSSKILVLVNTVMYNTQAGTEAAYTIYRDSTNLGTADGLSGAYTGVSTDLIAPLSMHILDSPSSTSSLTYAVYIKRTQTTGNAQINLRGVKQSITLLEIAG